MSEQPTTPTPIPWTGLARPRRDRVEVYRSGRFRKLWRWRYVAENGNILADSGQGYADRRDAVAGASRVTGLAPATGNPSTPPRRVLTWAEVVDKGRQP